MAVTDGSDTDGKPLEMGSGFTFCGMLAYSFMNKPHISLLEQAQ